MLRISGDIFYKRNGLFVLSERQKFPTITFETSLIMKQRPKVIKQLTPFNKGNMGIGLVFVGAICLTVWSVNIYRETIISTEYLFLVSLSGAIIGLILIPKFFKSSYSKAWIVLLSLSIGAGIFYFALLYFNKTFSEKEIISKEFKIVKTGTLGKGKFGICFQPYANINFNGTEKQLVFNCNFEKTIKNYSKVSATYSKGLFGFFIIKTKQLKL
ncbi:MAG: hypothetical protein ABIP35_11490 [Ginsengibacter sp.]